MEIIGDITRIKSKKDTANSDIRVKATKVICSDNVLGASEFSGDHLFLKEAWVGLFDRTYTFLFYCTKYKKYGRLYVSYKKSDPKLGGVGVLDSIVAKVNLTATQYTASNRARKIKSLKNL